MEKLRKQIDKYKDIVKQQEDLIQVHFIWATAWENQFLPYANICIHAVWSAPLFFAA